ncbi:MAG: hypothetical protein ACFFB3_00575, partial [Candidatus Hodarchaeota archaeon]
MNPKTGTPPTGGNKGSSGRINVLAEDHLESPIEDYVDNDNSDVDSSADLGIIVDFSNLTATDSRFANITELGYQMDQEVQFTAAAHFLTTEKLCIKTGSFSGTEDINVTIWTGSAWISIASDLVDSSWNNFSVAVNTTTFTIKFGGSTTSGDSTQDWWQIDAVLLQLSGVGSNEIYVMNNTANEDASSELGTLDDFSNMQAKDSHYANLTEMVIGQWWFASDDTEDSFTNTGFGEKHTLNFNAPTQGDYLIFVSFSVSGSSSSSSTYWRAQLDDTTTFMSGCYEVGVAYDDDYKAEASFYLAESLATGEHYVDVDAYTEAGTGYLKYIKITVLRLDDWLPKTGMYAYASTDAELELDAGEDTWKTAQTLTFTPDQAGYYLVLGYGELRTADTSDTGNLRLNYDSGSEYLPFENTEETSGENYFGYESKDATDIHCFTFGGLINIPASEKTIILEGCQSGGSTTGHVAKRRILALRIAAMDPSAATTEDKSVTSTSNQWQDKSTLQFTPTSQGDYLIIGGMGNKPDNENNPTSSRLEHTEGTNTGTLADANWDSKDASLPADVYPFFTTEIKELGTTQQTFKTQYGYGSYFFGTAYGKASFIVAIRKPSPNNRIDQESQWTDLPYQLPNEELCIYTGLTDAEDLRVDIWNGSGWENVLPNLTANSWNNVSVHSYLNSTVFTIRFVDGTQSSDTNQDDWEIDAILLHIWAKEHDCNLGVPLLVNDGQTYNLSTTTPEVQFMDSFLICVNYTEIDGITCIPGTANPTVRISSNLTQVSKVLMTNHDNGTFTITLNMMENATGPYSFNITATAANYQTQNDKPRNFEIVLRSTRVPEAKTRDLAFPNSTVVNSTINAQYEWLDNSSSPILDAYVTVLFNEMAPYETPIVNQVSAGIYNITVNASGIAWGPYSLNLLFKKYGYENQTVTVDIEIQGLPVSLAVDVPDILTRGEDFVLRAQLYQNQSLSEIVLLQESGNPIANEPLNFTVVVMFLNGTEYNFNQIDITNKDGIAQFTLSRDTTKEIRNFTRISISLSGSHYFQDTEFIVPFENYPQIRSQEKEEGQPIEQVIIEGEFIDLLIEFVTDYLLYITLILLCLAVLFVVGSYKFRAHKRTKKQHSTLLKQLKEIRSMQMVIIRHRDGVPLFAQDFFGSEDHFDLTVAGMSAAIGAFLEDLATSMLEDGTTEITEFLRMHQRGLHMLQRNGTHTAVIVITEIPVDKFTEENVRSLQWEIEDHFAEEFEHFMTNDQIPRDQLESMASKHLYTGLLGPIQLSEMKLESHKKHLSAQDKRLLTKLRSLKSILPNRVVFLLDSYLSHLQKRGFSLAVSAEFLLKGYLSGLFEPISHEELYQQQQQATVGPEEDSLPE